MDLKEQIIKEYLAQGKHLAVFDIVVVIIAADASI